MKARIALFSLLLLAALQAPAQCGLSAVVGTWTALPCGNFTSTATTTTYESSVLSGSYSDFTVEAVMIATRPVQPTAANTLFLRGTPLPLHGSAQTWDSGVAFNFTTNGKFSIFRYVGGVGSPLQPWTFPTGVSIAGSGSPNTLKVVASGGVLDFFINGVLVKTITGETLLSGQIGVGMVRSVPTDGDPDDSLEVVALSVTP